LKKSLTKLTVDTEFGIPEAEAMKNLRYVMKRWLERCKFKYVLAFF